MLIDGEKYACDACIRGHRVSSCQHNERPLSHINRKGRPVSQCPHCRGLRKARANHVKCECGTKPHSKTDCKKETKSVANDSNGAKNKQCCCSHGSRCICSGKRDSNLATVPEAGPAPSKRPLLSPLNTPLSSLKADTSGLSHRHRTRKDVNRYPQPYTIPRSHTAPMFPDLEYKSAEHLPLPDGAVDQNSSASQGPEPSGPVPIRRAVSEHGSPVPFDNLGPMDMSYPYLTGTSSSTSMEFLTQSAGSPYVSDVDPFTDPADFTSIDWSTYELNSPEAVADSAFSQPASYASYDFNGFNHPGLSRSNSGEMSDTGDISPIANAPMSQSNPLPTYDMGSIRDLSDAEQYRPNSVSSSYFTMPPQSQPQPQPYIASPSTFDGFDVDFSGGVNRPALPYSQSPSVQYQNNLFLELNELKKGYAMSQDPSMNSNQNFGTATAQDPSINPNQNFGTTTAQDITGQSYMTSAPLPVNGGVTDASWFPGLQETYPITASPVPVMAQNQFFPPMQPVNPIASNHQQYS